MKMRKISKVNIILYISLIFYTLLIIYFSLFSRPEEIIERIICGSSSTDTEGSEATFSKDLLFHFFSYLFYAFFCNILLYKNVLYKKHSILISVLIGGILNIALEFMQPYFGRNFSLEDFVYGFVGTLLGSLYYAVIMSFYE